MVRGDSVIFPPEAKSEDGVSLELLSIQSNDMPSENGQSRSGNANQQKHDRGKPLSVRRISAGSQQGIEKHSKTIILDPSVPF
jgi:hypothetical protein